MALFRKDGAYSQVLWGLLLMALGGAFLLDRMEVVDVPSFWKFWPLVLVVIGVGRLFEREPGSAATFLLMGLAFFAAEFHWLGLTYATFWPLLLVAIGVGIVIRAITAEESRVLREKGCCGDGEPGREHEGKVHD